MTKEQSFVHSLPIHIPQCQKKWMEMQLRKPSYERQLLPCLPVEASHVDKKTLLCKICEAEEETIAQMNQE